MLMKKIYLLLMALLVSCLYTPQAQADEVNMTIANTSLATGSGAYNTSTSNATTTKTYLYDTTPQIKLECNGSYKNTSNYLLITGGKTMTVSLSNGAKITKIVLDGYALTAASTTANGVKGVSIGAFNNGTWTYNEGSESVTFTAKGTNTRNGFKFTGMTITYIGDGGGEVKTPSIEASKTSIAPGEYDELPYTTYIKVTGSNLTGNVTATSSSDILTVTPSSYSKENVEAGNAQFTVTFNPKSKEDTATLTFASEEAEPIVINATAANAVFPEPSIPCETIKDLTALKTGDKAIYTGSDALVTYIYDNYVYVEDETAAIRLKPNDGVNISKIKQGNKLKNLQVQKVNNPDNPNISVEYLLLDFSEENLDSETYAVTPTPVDVSALTDPSNLYRFIRLNYGMFADAGMLLNGTTPRVFNVLGTTGVNINVINIDEFKDYRTPESVCTVAGINLYNPDNNQYIALYPRTPDDIKEYTVAIPKLTVSSPIYINSGDAEDALTTSFSISGTNITNNVTLSTANAGISFPTADLDAATVAAGTTAELNWVPSQVTAGSAIVKATTTFSYDEQTFTVATDIPVTVMGAPTFTYKAVMSGTEPEETNQLIIGGKMPVNKTIIVSATNLMGDVNIVCQNGITASPATISMTDYAATAEVILTIDADVSDFTKYVYFETAGLKNTSAYLTVKGVNAIPLTRVSTVKAIRDAQAANATVVFDGEAIVTYTDSEGFYMQDETAGIYVLYQEYTHPDQGDKLTDVKLKYYDIEGFLVGWALDSSDFTKSATGQTVVPTVVGADELGSQYADMLVKVEEIKLTSATGETTFTAGHTYAGTSPTGQVSVSPFPGNIAGTDIPTGYVDVTGIYATLIGDSRALRPRTLDDINPSENQNPLVIFITPTTADYASYTQAAESNVDMAEFTCQFFNLPAGSHAVVTYEPAGADIKLNKSDADASEAAADYLLPDGKYTLKLAAYAPAVGFYRNISVKFVFGAEETADNTREFTFLPLKVWNAGIDDTATLSSDDFEEGKTDTFKLVQNEYNSVTVTLTVTLANCYDAIVVTNPVQHPYGIEENTMILSLADAEQPVQPTALEDGDSDAEQAPLVLYPGEGGNGEYNLKLTMHCQYKFDTATPLTYTFVRQGDPNQHPLATLTVDYEANDVETDIEGMEAASELYRVYSLQGILLLDGVRAERVAELPAGLYIVNGKKVYIRK